MENQNISIEITTKEDSEFVLYLNGTKVDSKCIGDDFGYFTGGSFEDDFSYLKPGAYNGVLKLVNGDGETTLAEGTFNVLTTDGNVNVTVPTSLLTTENLVISLTLPLPEESIKFDYALRIYLDPVVEEWGIDSDPSFDRGGDELEDYWGKTTDIDLGPLSEGLHKLYVLYCYGVWHLNPLDYPDYFSNPYDIVVSKPSERIDTGMSIVNDNGVIVITLFDASGNPIPYTEIGYKMGDDGKVAAVTNEKGQVAISGLTGKFRAVSTFAGTQLYKPSSCIEYFDIPIPGSKATVLTATAAVVDTNATIKITLADVDGNKLTKVVKVKVGNYVGDVNVTNGEGSLTLNNLNVGTYTADVKFAGDENYTNSSASTSFEIKPVYPTAAIITPSVETTYKDAVIRVTLTDKYGAKLNGVVTVTIGNDTYNVTVTNGEGSLALSNLAAGFYSANVAYAGDANHNNASSVVSFAISNAVLLANDTKRGWNSPYDYYATLVDINGKPIAGKDITFTIDGNTYKATTGADGIAKVAAKLDVGTHSVVVTNPDTGANFTVTAVIVERIQGYGDITKDYLGPESYVVQVFGDDGNPVGEGEVVQVRFAGKTYNMTTNASGYIVRTINFVPGSYAVYSIYAGYQTPQTGITVNQILKASSVTAKKSKGYVTLQATLKSSSGKAITGKEIKFTFKGRTYFGTTNSKGVASCNVDKDVVKKLAVGEKYTYKATYVSDTVSGKVIVKK